MTHCEKLYNFFIEHPKATADEVMESLGWERRQDPCDGVQVLRAYREEDDNNPIHDYKQDAYRQAADACLDRIHDPETTIPQLIELIRELRMILKAIVPA